MSIFALLIMILHSGNKVKFRNNEYEKYFISFNKAINFKEIIENYKDIITKNFNQWKESYEIIYFFIFFIKKFKEQTNIQSITDKFLLEYPALKKDKKLVAFFIDFIDKELVCNRCNNSIGNCGCFRCRTCDLNVCPKCFDDLDGTILNKYQVNQKGQIDKHPHILEYKNVIERKIPITARPLFVCKICQGQFLMEYVDAWNCPRCGYDYCDKCFKENGGRII